MKHFLLTTDALVRKGYLFKEATGLFSCERFAEWWKVNVANFSKHDFDPKSRGASQSFPKDSRSRRLLTFPNPQHFVQLAGAIDKHWLQIQTYSETSTISISRLGAPQNSRAVGYFRDPRELLRERVARRVGKRYYLHLDIARFFPSVYLHRLETIFPGTNASGHNDGLGSKLDNLSRRMQHNESIGLPLGPDTSFVLAEVLATYIDRLLPKEVSAIRHVDDISIYADNLVLLEKSLVSIHAACNGLRLELNNLKTLQGAMPDELEPDWVSQLRPLASSVRSTDSLITFFDRSFVLHKRGGDNRLINYAISAATTFGLREDNWKVFESLLLTSVSVEPRSVALVGKVVLKARNLGRKLNRPEVVSVYRKFILQHAGMNHGYEVNRAIWTLVELNIAHKITQRDWAIIAQMDDNFVAVTALWLRDAGLPLPKVFSNWTNMISHKSAYSSQNWLLCHEANLRGWLPAAAPTAAFWHAALKDRVSFIDETGGTFAEKEEPTQDDVAAELEIAFNPLVSGV